MLTDPRPEDVAVTATRKPFRVRLVVVLALAAALVAVGVAYAASGGDSPTGPPLPIVDGKDHPHEVVTPAPGETVRTEPVELEAAIVTDDGITVLLWGGVAPCFVVDTVEVTETDEDVTVTVTAGAHQDDPDAICIQIAHRYGVEIALDAPLGDRAVVDGSGAS